MRDPDRITDFMQRLHDIWQQECPDWRFGQLICNVFSQLDFDPFMLEDDQMLYEIERYFGLVDISEDPIAVHKELIHANFDKRRKKGGPKIYDREGKLVTRTYECRTSDKDSAKKCGRKRRK